MAGDAYDLVVIGGGSGGVRAARLAAGTGARVAIVEEHRLGGTCVNRGCIPKKLLVYASHFRRDAEDAERGYGWRLAQPAFEWPRFLRAKNREIERLNGVYAQLLEAAGVTRLKGRARLVDPHAVAVDGRRLGTRHVLVATGSRPVLPELPGVEHGIVSDDAFFLERLPRRILIVGGGYVAVEFAGIFHGLGADVTLVHRGAHLLRGFDDDLRSHLARELGREGIELRLHRSVAALERVPGGLRATLDDGDSLAVDQVLFATGRVPRTAGLGLEQAGVALAENGAVRVDALSRSSVASVWAIGDVTDRLMLTPVAIHEAICLVKTLFGGEPTGPDYEGVPTAVFSQPPVGTVGLTEARARQQHDAVDVYTSCFRPLKQTLTGRAEETFVKLVVERATDRVLGLHMVGSDAAEIVQGFAVALKGGATKADFDATVGIHPTAAEEFVTLR